MNRRPYSTRAWELALAAAAMVVAGFVLILVIIALVTGVRP